MAAAKKILKLDQFAIEDDFFEDAVLIGITSDRPVYSLALSLNQGFNLAFERKPSLDVCVGKKSKLFWFAVYQCKLPGTAFVQTLYRIKAEDMLLLPSVKNIDYVWLFRSDNPEPDAAEYVRRLRHLPEVQFAGILEQDKIKNIEHLIL